MAEELALFCGNSVRLKSDFTFAQCSVVPVVLNSIVVYANTYEGDPNADGAMTMLYHLYVGGVNSVICGCRIVSTRPNSQVHKVIQHALHRQHWDPLRTLL